MADDMVNPRSLLENTPDADVLREMTGLAAEMLRTHFPLGKLFELGSQVDTVKKLSPTIPHPRAPRSELFHRVIGPGVSLDGRLLDKLTGGQSRSD